MGHRPTFKTKQTVMLQLENNSPLSIKHYPVIIQCLVRNLILYILKDSTTVSIVQHSFYFSV